jgi:hypothetical protein
MSTAKSINRMVSRQGICVSNGIVRCGQVHPVTRQIAPARRFATAGDYQIVKRLPDTGEIAATPSMMRSQGPARSSSPASSAPGWKNVLISRRAAAWALGGGGVTGGSVWWRQGHRPLSLVLVGGLGRWW